ncbi:MAG: acyl-ACP--UDP-N-acetylglucosamine O-acyltransferase [Candidatus Marinamargulisbacteria bacterium]
MNHLLEKLQPTVPQVAIDKVVAIDLAEGIVTIKNISVTDPFFNGRAGHHPLPRQALIDAHIQSGLVYLMNQNHLDDHRFQLDKIDEFTAHQHAFPGDQIRIETQPKSCADDDTAFEARAYIDGKECSSIRFTIRQSNASTSGTFIHPTASVHASAVLAQGVHVGPYCIINDGVHIGENTLLRAHVMIDKWSQIGANNTIEYGAVIGAPPQDIKYNGEPSQVVMGDHNQIREYVTINRATGKDNMTKIGSNNMLLTNTHIGHNCTIGDHVVMANVVHLGGHTVIQDYVTIGGLTGVHQFVRIGMGAMVGGYSRLIQDVPPFMLCDGNPAYVRNLNAVGCRRRGMSRSTINELKQLFKLLYRSNLNTKQAIAAFEPKESLPEVDQLLSFIQVDASRGISKKVAVESSSE